MFERPPFQKCFSCGSPEGLGILWVGHDTLQRRCRFCRQSVHEPLPAVNKKVIYLDQLAISEIFKTKHKTRKAGAPHERFWQEALELCEKSAMLQQAIFPASNIHRNESLVFEHADELQLMHEMLAGDVTLREVDEVEQDQVWQHLDAYLENRVPVVTLNVDEIMDGDRNAWLSDLHITANLNWSQFVDGIRAERESAAEDMKSVYARWASTKPNFESVLEEELDAFGSARVSGYVRSVQRTVAAAETGNVTSLYGNLAHPFAREFFQIKDRLISTGVDEKDAVQEVLRFWSWPANRGLPFNRISSYLFAALARKVSNGQRKISRGMMNDIRAIATYGPYVDAMFLDNECANFLQEEPLASEVKLKAKVFSLNTGEEFLDYLGQVCDGADEETRRYANEIFGVA